MKTLIGVAGSIVIGWTAEQTGTWFARPHQYPLKTLSISIREASSLFLPFPNHTITSSLFISEHQNHATLRTHFG